MVNLSKEMTALAERLGPPPADAARVIQFMAARQGEGVSTVAREFARAVAPNSQKGVWLVELDVMASAQFDAVASQPRLYGDLGEAVRASPTGEVFFQLTPPHQGPDGRAWPDASLLTAYPVGDQRFWLTRFRKEALRRGQTVSIKGDGGYWNALRPHADWVIVDAPSAERSRAGLIVAAQMDATLLVVSAEQGDPRGPAFVRDHLEAVGGPCAGVVLNHLPPPAPKFLRALTP